MRILAGFALTVLLSAQVLAQHSLEKIWETEPVLKFPEGLVLEPGGKFLCVTNTDGNPMAKDGKGSIGKIGLDGKVIQVDWVAGMDAPKGLGQYGDLLYAADLDQLVVVASVLANRQQSHRRGRIHEGESACAWGCGSQYWREPRPRDAHLVVSIGTR
ncbi:MAG TPA: hypothetical protein VMG82_13130 [Candidatus Sulfotelmatobacter sp.]|nr:hypothetical protein [Candidatus Sulfotelmatobacter sp.]